MFDLIYCQWPLTRRAKFSLIKFWKDYESLNRTRKGILGVPAKSSLSVLACSIRIATLVQQLRTFENHHPLSHHSVKLWYVLWNVCVEAYVSRLWDSLCCNLITCFWCRQTSEWSEWRIKHVGWDIWFSEPFFSSSPLFSSSRWLQIHTSTSWQLMGGYKFMLGDMWKDIYFGICSTSYAFDIISERWEWSFCSLLCSLSHVEHDVF